MSAESDTGSKLKEIPISPEEFVPSLEAFIEAIVLVAKHWGTGRMEDLADGLKFRTGERGLSGLIANHEGASSDLVKQAVKETIARLHEEMKE